MNDGFQLAEVIKLRCKTIVTICGVVVLMVACLGLASYGHPKTPVSNSTSANYHISYPPTSVVHHPDGSITYEYDVNGFKSITTLPPKDFNPLTASNSELTKYGYPSRPIDKSQLKKWQYFVTHRIIQTPGNLVVYPNVRN